MLTPIELIKSTVDAMAGAALVASSTSPRARQGADRHPGPEQRARSGLTGFVAGLARSNIAARGVTIKRPAAGAFDTDRLRGTNARRGHQDRPAAGSADGQACGCDSGARFGTADEFGAVCAFMCSMHAGYLTGKTSARRRRLTPARSDKEIR